VGDGPLTQDYDAHARFTFVAVPASPPAARAGALVRRWFTIAFAQSWLAVLLFRLKVRLRDAGVPVAPAACDLLSRALFRVQIGEAVTAGPGLMIPHGNAVIDGRTTIGRNCTINPWVTIGLSNSRKLGFSPEGPTIGDDVHIGTGAKILGPVRIGDHARIGANAVVIHDVPANSSVAGIPARVIGGRALGEDGDLSGRDGPLVRRMREAIVDYRLRRCSLRSLVDVLGGSFEIGSDSLRAARAGVATEMSRLERAAGLDNAAPDDLLDALLALDSALAEYR
jgi:serine O-acetyltransferase